MRVLFSRLRSWGSSADPAFLVPALLELPLHTEEKAQYFLKLSLSSLNPKRNTAQFLTVNWKTFFTVNQFKFFLWVFELRQTSELLVFAKVTDLQYFHHATYSWLLKRP